MTGSRIRRCKVESDPGFPPANQCLGDLAFGLIELAKSASRCRSRLVLMTINDYNVTMSNVRIADLKSHLSEHLRKVRAGRSLTILDRDTPIARVVPWEGGDLSLKVRPPLSGAPKLHRVKLPAPLRAHADVVTLLMQERQGDR